MAPRIRSTSNSFTIVGIGASSSGLDAFTQLLKKLPVDTGMAFVLVQHLDPKRESILTSLLAHATQMPVAEATHNLRVVPDHVYVIPPNVDMALRRGVLRLQPRPRGRAPHRSVDFFLTSLAEDQQERAIGVILSGSATDGTLGQEAIKTNGGLTFAQDASARSESMPHHATAAGFIDRVLPPGQIARELASIARHRRTHAPADPTPRQGAAPAASPAKAAQGLRKILQLLRTHSGVDFSLYKTSTIERRIARRVGLTRNPSLAHYATFIQRNPKELDALYTDVLIGVTSFFRDPDAFTTLKRKVFPALLANRDHDTPVRIWTLGCSTGQEPYSLAMAYAEFAEKIPGAPRLQIFASDLNEAALEKARRGFYATPLVHSLSPARLRRFFIEEKDGYRINSALREQVVFARQNLLSDPPFSRMDLISCRNVMIYLEESLQKKIIPLFHYALRPGGFLFLGASESVGPFTQRFSQIDKQQKIFSKQAAATTSSRLPLPPTRSASTHLSTTATESSSTLRSELEAQREADRIALNQFAPPGVLIDNQFQVLQFRGATGPYLEPPAGRASFDLLKMAREGLMLPLRAAITQAKRAGRTVRRDGVNLSHDGRTLTVSLHVIPLKNLRTSHYLVVFAASPTTPVAPPESQPLSRRKKARHVDTAEMARELAETYHYIRTVQEQHEIANEELRASHDEVQSANEELQSINEELETSKEELESTNEELLTVNEEMLHSNAELLLANGDLKNLQVGTHTAILLLGPDLTIRRFTPLAEKALNLVATDLGRPLTAITHGLSTSNLAELVLAGLNDPNQPDQEVQDRTGRWYLLRVRPYLTLEDKVDGAVLALIDIDTIKRHERELELRRDYAEAIIRTVHQALIILDRDLRVKSASERFYTDFNTTPEQTEGRQLFELGQGEWRLPQLRQQLLEVLPHQRAFTDFELACNLPSRGARIFLLKACPLKSVQPSKLILLTIEDITEQREAQAALKRSELRYRRLFETAEEGIITLDPKTRKITETNPVMTRLLGYSREELIGRELWEIGMPGDKPANQTAFRTLRKKGSIRYDNLPLKTNQGEPCEVEFINNLYDEDGLQVAQCSIRDITHRKQTETALRKAIEELKLSQENTERASRAKDDFLASLSHELRMPLTPVLLSIAILREDARLPPDVYAELGMVERNIELEARLIDDLLDLTKLAHGKLILRLQPIDAHYLIGLAIDIVRDSARKKSISLDCNYTAHRSRLLADPTRFQQVIWNLLSNAIKFTPEGGRIVIATREISPAPGEHGLEITIKDSGRGIDPAQLDLIFRSFEQGDITGNHRFGGIGLGLAIARAIVDQHGGRIKALSEGVNLGSTFVIELPGATLEEATSTDSAETTESRSTASPVPTRELRLLVVEDHPSTLRALTRLLTREGHHVTPVASVSAALASAAKDAFDYVISDLGLPDASGIELMTELRTRHGLRGVALTGYGSAQDIAAAQTAGFIAHLVKPVSIEELRTMLAKLAAG